MPFVAALLLLGASPGPAASDDTPPRPVPLPRLAKARMLEGHTSIVRCVAFKPGTHRLVSGGSDRAVRRWDVDKGVLLGEHLLPRGG